MNYGEILKEARLRKGYTQEHLRKTVGMTRKTYIEIEKNISTIPKKCVNKLEEILDITIPLEAITKYKPLRAGILSEARRSKGYTMEYIASKLGINKGCYNALEGRKKIPIKYINKLQEILDIIIPREYINSVRTYKCKGIITDARLRKEYSQAYITRRLGINSTYWCDMEHGRRKIPKDLISRLEELLDIIIPEEMIGERCKPYKPKNFSQTAMYGTEIKDKIRTKVFQYIKPDDTILTLPSVFGLCVRKAIEYGAVPSNITCVEYDSKTMLDYKSLMLGTNNHTGTLLNYLLYTKETFDVAFLDFCGTLTDTTASEIKIAGTMVNDVIGITLNVAHRVKNSRYNKEIVESCKQLLPDFCLHEEPYHYTDEGKRSEMVFLLFKKMKIHQIRKER